MLHSVTIVDRASVPIQFDISVTKNNSKFEIVKINDPATDIFFHDHSDPFYL
jgi:hypothetical protein